MLHLHEKRWLLSVQLQKCIFDQSFIINGLDCGWCKPQKYRRLMISMAPWCIVVR
jgi:hypothetical protein